MSLIFPMGREATPFQYYMDMFNISTIAPKSKEMHGKISRGIGQIA